MLKSRGSDRRKIIFLISDGSNSRNNGTPSMRRCERFCSRDVSVYSIAVGQRSCRSENR